MLSWAGDNPALERAALAMEGYIADQKAVLYFQPDPEASEFMARFTAEGELVDVHKELLDRGLAFHTLRPTSEGTVVYVYGQDQETLNKVGETAKGLNAEMAWTAGKGEFIGTQKQDGTDREQRDDARQAYEAEISQSAGSEARPVWEELRDRWTKRLEQSRDQKVADFEWNEEDHPRDPDGKFTSGGGSSSSASSGSPASEHVVAPASSIAKLPTFVKRIADPSLKRAIERGAFDVHAEPWGMINGEQRYELVFTPKPMAGVLSFKRRATDKHEEQYNPKLATLEAVDTDTDYAWTMAKANPGLVTDIAPPPGDLIYRGMSAEEYQQYERTGVLKSLGDYNFTGQEGLTYFSNDVNTAVSYANGFAPWQYKPTFERPAYVVAIKRPDPKHVTNVQGTGENEVGVNRPVTREDVTHVWRGDVYSAQAARFELREEGYNTGEYRGASGNGGSARVVWSRVEQTAAASQPSPPITGPLVPDPPTQIGEMTSIPRLPGATWEEEVRAYGKHVAGVLGYPPEKIVVTSAEHKFRVNGVDYVAAGTAHHDTGEVKLYTANIGSNHSSFVGLVAHEVEHQRFFTVMDAYLKEATEVHQLTAPVQDIMHPDGTLKPPYDARFPVYAGWVKTYNGKEMAAQDGVSDYSAAYWEGYKVNQVQIDSAIHETLAEIARFDATGIAPRLTAIKEKPVWVAFYDFVNSTYDRLTSQHVTRSLAKGIRAEKRALRKEWAAHEAQMEAIKAYQLEHPETAGGDPTTSMINALLERQRK